ncbi:beta-mannosidase [Hoeflea marina]|uniref:beta-mannosidase n=1 Tax=Hoeflea marina TaxID=274592 RepID=A0A317PIZ9_9HYPH|nr:glycoside hydrolase family 2 protein [Hoeflea marina]PWV99187.1 beta-mannosidase [Hoeflea marina]
MDISPSPHANISGETIRRLDSGWTMHLCEPGAWSVPGDLPEDLDLIPAIVPGTVAAALEQAGRFDRDAPVALDGIDAWYRLRLRDGLAGEALLRLEGLATLSDVFVNAELVLRSESMFTSHDVPVRLTGEDTITIRFRALAPELARKGPRARWRPRMITPAGLRLFRTTVLGRMPGWCPEIHAAGPWRPVSLIRRGGDAVTDLTISARLDADGTGLLRVRLAGGLGGIIHCAGHSAPLVEVSGSFVADLAIPGVRPWWPATHGEPVLHEILMETGGVTRRIGRTGFRRIEVEQGTDGFDFGLRINGVKVFCRGAAWTSADIVRLPGGREDYRPWLGKAAEAGMNMIRIGGTMAYESPDFFALCDEMGLMVWQDFMLANFHYPMADEAWMALVELEARQILAATSASPSMTVLCGGSEIHQQAAMLGLPREVYEGPLTEDLLPGIVAELRPDCVYVPNSPHGGAMPFSPNAGVSHYYGVGAYCRPLEDARRANVRFAAESLAFAHVPAQSTLDAHLPVPPVHDPRWKASVPRDRDASWDFEDIREHYLRLLYEVDPARLRRENPALYLDLSRVVTGEVIEATFAEWRRRDSSCNGALIWTFQDLMPGAGWGLVDSTGLPKPAYFAAKRAFRPVQIALTDEGTNGVDVHLLNDGAGDRAVVAEIVCLRDGTVPVASGRKELVLAASSASTIAATDFFGAFFDTAYAYRFGPPSHNVTLARLIDAETGAEIASSFHFPSGRAAARHEANLTALLIETADGYALEIATDRFAQNVEIAVTGAEPEDNWFHLAPGRPRLVRLGSVTARPGGEVRLAGGRGIVPF